MQSVVLSGPAHPGLPFSHYLPQTRTYTMFCEEEKNWKVLYTRVWIVMLFCNMCLNGYVLLLF